MKVLRPPGGSGRSSCPRVNVLASQSRSVSVPSPVTSGAPGRKTGGSTAPTAIDDAAVCSPGLQKSMRWPTTVATHSCCGCQPIQLTGLTTMRADSTPVAGSMKCRDAFVCTASVRSSSDQARCSGRSGTVRIFFPVAASQMARVPPAAAAIREPSCDQVARPLWSSDSSSTSVWRPDVPSWMPIGFDWLATRKRLFDDQENAEMGWPVAVISRNSPSSSLTQIAPLLPTQAASFCPSSDQQSSPQTIRFAPTCLSSASSRPVSISQTRTTPSVGELLASLLPSGDQASSCTFQRNPVNARSNREVFTSQIRTTPSTPPVARRRPSGEKTIL